jgi:hypothetical protein
MFGIFKRPACLLGVFVLLCSLHLWLYANMPEARRNWGWPSIVMRNWHEQGFWHLGGKLVSNAGGLDSGEAPSVYPGHRSYFLILPYWLKELPGAAGGNGLLYDFAIVLATFAGLLRLFGTGIRGVAMAFATCLSPGFFANVADIDTIAFPALMGIAVMAFVGGCLTQTKEKSPWRGISLAMVVVYMLMNWSTLFSLCIAAVYVWAVRPDWKSLGTYFGVGLLVGLAVFAVSILSRHESGTTSGDFWNGYLWGPAGYTGTGMTWGKAVVRIFGVNVIAWLPLALVAPALLASNGRGPRWRLAPLPLIAAIVMVLGPRNYIANHPWNVVSVIGLGLLFSLELLIAPDRLAQPAPRRGWIAAAAAGSLLFCVAWHALDKFNVREFNALHALVYENTPRHSLIVLADDPQPQGNTDVEGLAGGLDRKVITAAEWESRRAEIERSGKEVFVLGHEASLPHTRLVAESRCPASWDARIMVPLFNFYRSTISRRPARERLVYFSEYRLYRY